VSSTVPWRGRALRAGTWVATGVALPVWTVAAATGALYLLYAHGLFAAGIAVPGALPLEGLAGHAGQPALRAVAAWGACGAAAGCVLAMLHGPRPGQGLAAFAAGTAVAIVLSGAAGRALMHNGPLGPQIVPELESTSAAVCWGVLSCGAGVGALGVVALRSRRAG
jgi:hypothetical protein